MTDSDPTTRRGALMAQLRWFVRLRWIAGATMVLAAWAEHQWLGWFDHDAGIALIGGAVLAYNAVLLWLLNFHGNSRRNLLGLAWFQLLADMICLATLVTWTGGIRSPAAMFFVFHMVFASLLLPRAMAYAGAVSAVAMLTAGLWLSGQWPRDRQDGLALAGEVVTLVLTVHLANRTTRALRRQRRRLLRQNRAIKRMTRQLRRHQQALVQHEKMVAMGQMAAGVTHEIANPLASMDGVLQLAERRPERINAETIGTLREQVKRINQIIQQMKSFAHPAETQWQTIELNEVVERAIEMLRFDPRLKRVKIERFYGNDVGSLTMLPQAIEQVLVNLIVNALDAMAQTAQPTLTLRTSRREGVCLVEITDNGHGIEAQHMGRVFEPFFTTKPVGQGTGLGLSISYSLIQKQGGSIAVRSERSKGTTFVIRLPVDAASQGIAGGSQEREAPVREVVISEKSSG